MRHISKKAELGKRVKTGFGSYIESGAKIGDNVTIGNFTCIHSQAIIQNNCIIGDYCTIGHPSKLQLQRKDFSATSPKVKEFIIQDPFARVNEDSIIRSGSVIYAHTILGKNLRTGHSVLIREHVTLGNNCVVGTQAILDGYIKVGNKSMIQSQCYVTQSVKIGNGVFIAPKCVFLDNKKMILGKGLSGVILEDYVRVGGGARILPGVTIGKYALIGAGAIVAKSVPPKAVAYGTPAEVKALQEEKEIRDYVDSILKWE